MKHILLASVVLVMIACSAPQASEQTVDSVTTGKPVATLDTTSYIEEPTAEIPDEPSETVKETPKAAVSIPEIAVYEDNSVEVILNEKVLLAYDLPQFRGFFYDTLSNHLKVKTYIYDPALIDLQYTLLVEEKACDTQARDISKAKDYGERKIGDIGYRFLVTDAAIIGGVLQRDFFYQLENSGTCFRFQLTTFQVKETKVSFDSAKVVGKFEEVLKTVRFP